MLKNILFQIAFVCQISTPTSRYSTFKGFKVLDLGLFLKIYLIYSSINYSTVNLRIYLRFLKNHDDKSFRDNF